MRRSCDEGVPTMQPRTPPPPPSLSSARPAPRAMMCTGTVSCINVFELYKKTLVVEVLCPMMRLP